MRVLIVLLCAALAQSVSFAADWEVANDGLSGYTVADVAIDFTNPNVLYCSTKAGVYKSTNGGASWTKSSTGLATTPYAGQLCMDPTDSSRIYVQASDSGGSRYIWRTDNSAGSWSQKSSGIGHPYVRGVTVSKSSPSIVYCGTIIGGDNGGCYKSTNSGDTWAQVAGSDVAGSGLGNDCTPVVVDPTNADRVYCGRSHYTGFIKSIDGGYHWTWTDNSYVVRGIAVNPDNPSRIIACGEGKLRLSTNYGDSFVDKVAGRSFQSVAHAPSNSSIVYATATSGGIWKSTDSGDTWGQVSGSEFYSYTRLAIHPTDPNTIYCVTSGRGIAKTTDGGHTFAFLNSGLPTEITVSFMENQAASGAIYAFVNYVGLYRTFDEGASWQFVSTMSDFPKGLAICDAAPSTMYYVAWPVDKVMKSTDGGFSWAPTAAQPGANYYESIAVDPTNPNRVFVSGENTDRVYRTTDGGQTWQAVHNLAASPDWGNRTAWTITIDPTNQQRIYLATYNCPWRSDDGGDTWVKQDTLHYTVIYNGVPRDTSFVRKIDVDAASPNILYASTQWGGTWKSTDYGDHWSRVWDMGGSTTNNTAIDSRNHNTVYITTLGQGVMKSVNAGASWTGMSSGLVGNDLYPNVIRQSVANPSRLYIGGPVNGIYRTPGGGWGLTIDQAKALPDGAYCLLAEDPVVSLKYGDGSGCLENANRLRGIRATNLGTFSVGEQLHVTGTIRADDADRLFQVDKATPVSTGNAVKALSMGAKALNASGAPSGIRSRVWGTVTDAGEGWCYLDDGSGAVDGTGRQGVKVRLGSAPALQAGSFAAVEGVLGRSSQDGLTVPCIVLNGMDNVLIGSISNYLSNPGFETGSFAPWSAGTSGQLVNGAWYFSIAPHTGGVFAGVYGNYATYSGAIQQRAEVRPSQSYSASVWSRVLHGGNDANSAMNRIGIDPTGGTDPLSPNVQWSDWDSQSAWYYSEWRRISTPVAAVQGSHCTVFLEYLQQNTAGWHLNCFDDAVLEGAAL